MCPDFSAPRESLLDVVRAGIEAETDDMGRFWGTEVSLEIETR